jgi:hypothetical protein
MVVIDKMNLKYFGLRKEAYLLDSHLYIIKAMVALAFAYLVSQRVPIVSIDKVSVLLGVMYNLEAANVLGLRGGFNQLLASSLGALVTGILIILLNYQVGVISIVFGMGLTMWIALKIDYRFVSPVAIFTSLYMNLLLQNNAAGDPSVFSTFVVRLLALGFGIGVAILFNALFSFVYYKNLALRRLEHVKVQTVKGLRRTLELMQGPKNSTDNLAVLGGLFNDIEVVKAHLDSLNQEKFWLSESIKKQLPIIQTLVLEFKNILHLAYDLLYLKELESSTLSSDQLQILNQIVDSIDLLDFTKDFKLEAIDLDLQFEMKSNRFEDSIHRIQVHYQHLTQHINS